MGSVRIDHARVFTGAGFSAPRPVLADHGRVVATGADAEDGRADRTIDLDGRWLMPGFIESHGHPAMFALTLLELDVGPAAAGSIAEIKALLTEEVRGTRPGEWIRGSGWEENYLAERRVLTRDDLDEVAPDHPVVLTRTCRHNLVANSRALQLSGLDEATPDPAGGRLARDAGTGRLTGMCQEKAMDLVALPPRTVEEHLEALTLAMPHLSRTGVTTVHDMSTGRESMRAYTAMARDGSLAVRLRPWLWAKTQMGMPGLLEHVLRTGVGTGLGDDMVRVQGMKFVLDGAISSRTAAMAEPFADLDDTGILYDEDDDEIISGLRAALDGDLRLAVHAIGERAIDQAIRCLRATGREDLVRRRRTRIEHCAVPTETHLDDLVDLRLIACCSTGFVHHLGDSYLGALGPERAKRLFPHRDLIDRGIVAPGNSDFPVTPVNPWCGIHAAVTRTSSTGAVLDTVQNITLEEAIRAYTTDAAFTSFEEDTLGTITPGAHADLQVYEQDPFAVETSALLGLAPVATYLAGRAVHTA